MLSTPIVTLHTGAGLELGLLAYLSRVLFHLVAFGAVAILVYWGTGVLHAVRSALGGRPPP